VQIHAVLAIVRRRLLPLLLCILAGAAGAVLVTRDTPKTYGASDTLIVNIPQASSPQEALQGVQLSSQLLASYAQVATSRSAATQVKTQLGLPEGVDDVRGKLSAAPVPETLLLKIGATDQDPVRAASLADSAALVFIGNVAKLEADKTNKVVPSVVDAAVVPTSPVSPRPKLNLAVGLFAGLLVGSLLALLLEALDRSVKGPTQLGELAQGPVLGIIPRLGNAARLPISTLEQPLTPSAESYRALRTAIHFIDPDQPLQTILITSAGPDEGKSTTAAHFAVALAQSGERVVLVDGDLRRGSLYDLFGLPSGAGVTSVVTGAASLDDVLQSWQELLPVMGTGPLPPNPAEILGSQAMAAMLEHLREMADVVVIDAPPVLPVTDAVALSTQVDGVVLVARDSRTNRHSIVEARRRLDGVGANVVGCVLNAAKTNSDLYSDYTYLRPTKETGRSRLAARLSRESRKAQSAS
jgi:capsular exopolysaccharide synthesis family protein